MHEKFKNYVYIASDDPIEIILPPGKIGRTIEVKGEVTISQQSTMQMVINENI
jgi:hypothetical protein